MARTKFVAPKLTRKQLWVDELGQVNEQIKELEAYAEKLKAKVLRSEGLVEASAYKANVYEMTSVSLDNAKVKAALGPLKYARCLKSKVVRCVRVTAL